MNITPNIKLVCKHFLYGLIAVVVSAGLNYISQQDFGPYTSIVGLVVMALLNIWENWEVSQGIKPIDSSTTPPQT